jgi:hypothetical protein
MTTMYNLSGICESRPRNMKFQSFFATNWQFTVKPYANNYGFRAKNSIF